MTASALPVALVGAAALLGAVGQFLFREGSLRATGHWPHPITVVGAGCYLGVMALFGRAFRGGGSVPTLYPVYASTFIWAALIGHVVHGSVIRAGHVAGMLLLLVGTWLMARP